MSIQEILITQNSPQFHCPNCTRLLPLLFDPFTFCSDRCMNEFDEVLIPSQTDDEWEEGEEGEEGNKEN